MGSQTTTHWNPVNLLYVVSQPRDTIWRCEDGCDPKDEEHSLLPRLEPAFKRLQTWPTAVSVADTTQDDCPLIFVNDAFTDLTGYGASDCIGHNCRFLQGAETDPATVTDLRASVQKLRQITICLVNYRKNGTPFHNLLVMAPVDQTDHRHLIMGCQYELQRAQSDPEIKAQLSSVNGAFKQIDRPGDPYWKLFSDSIDTRTVATRMLVDSYMARVVSMGTSWVR